MNNVLLTGFAPYGDDTEKPSQQNAAHHPLADSKGGRLQYAELAVAGALACRSTLPLGRCYERLQGNAGFVRMPHASACIARRRHLAPSLPMSMLVEALDLIVQECMQ